MKALGITQGCCSDCGKTIPAKLVADGDGVSLQTFCPVHGERKEIVWSDADTYIKTHRYVKPAWVPKFFSGDATVPCPEGCGFCERHEQHLCLPIVEVTTRCDLHCPVCIVDAGGGWDMTREEFAHVLRTLLATEHRINVLNLSGGEPLLHPDLPNLLDEALSHPEIVRVSLSTNGLRLLDDPSLVRELRRRDVVIALQFDGFSETPYEVLRGRPLLDAKLRLLDLLGAEQFSTSLTMTVARGVNDDQFPAMLECLFGRDHVSSLMIQPVAFTGRAASLPEEMRRLTLPDVVRLLGEAGHPAVSASDFLPLPCSHPLCFSLAFYLLLRDGGAVSMTRLVDAATLLDSVANRVFFGLDSAEFQRLRELVYELWSAPAASVPDSEAVLNTVRDLLRHLSRGCRDPRDTFRLGERRLKSIFIHAFQDAETFDLARARRCCNAYPQSDGRLMPACVYNAFHRGKDCAAP